MTSYPVGNKTSLSRKPCMATKTLLWNSGSHGRYLRIRHKKSPEAPPGGEIIKTSYLATNKTSLSRKPCIADKKITIMKS